MYENRKVSLDYAIKANLEHTINRDGNSIPDVDKLIESAKKIENYLKGNEPFIEGHSNNPNNPDTKFKGN